MQFRSNSHVIVFLALLASVAVVLSYFERFIPMPMAIPGMKLGLANTITVASFYFFKKKQVFAVVIIRIVLTTLLTGNMMGFIYSFSGGLLSFAGMAMMHHYFKKWFSPIGISVAGAYLHNLAQLSVLAFVTDSITVAVSYSPVIMISSLATGLFVGITAVLFSQKVLGHFLIFQQ